MVPGAMILDQHASGQTSRHCGPLRCGAEGRGPKDGGGTRAESGTL